MGLMHCRTSPKAERNERIRTVQAEAILSHLERCGYRIVKTAEDHALQYRRVRRCDGGDRRLRSILFRVPAPPPEASNGRSALNLHLIAVFKRA